MLPGRTEAEALYVSPAGSASPNQKTSYSGTKSPRTGRSELRGSAASELNLVCLRSGGGEAERQPPALRCDLSAPVSGAADVSRAGLGSEGLTGSTAGLPLAPAFPWWSPGGSPPPPPHPLPPQRWAI